MADKHMVQLSASFDYTNVVNGINNIKKQLSSVHLGDDIAKNLKKSLEKIELEVPALKKLDGVTELSQKEVDKYLKLLEKLNKEIKNFNIQLENTDFTHSLSKIDTSKIEEIDKKIKETQDRLKTARKDLAKEFTKDNFGTTKSKTIKNAITQLFEVEPSEIENKFKEIEDNVKREYDESINRMEQLLRNSKAEDLVGNNTKIIEAFYGKGSKVEVASGQGKSLEKTIRSARSEIQKFAEGTPKAIEIAKNLLDLLSTTGVNKNKDSNARIFNMASIEDIDNLTAVKDRVKDIKILLDEKKDIFTPDQEEIIKLLADRVKALEEALNAQSEAAEVSKKETKELTDAFEKETDALLEGAEAARKNQARQDALNATFGTLAHRIENTVSAITIFNKSLQIVRNAIKSVEDLDAAFTQIAIVSEKSSEEAWEMFESFNKLAKQYSITTKDLTEGAKLFYQQGLNAVDTMKMVEASTISAALGEVTMSEAANTLTAAIQGYNESASVAMDYTDKIAMVGAVSAADFNELSAAMEKTASSAYTAGLDFDNLLGYLGKMIEVTREAPANLGTAMKTIIARFEDMKKNPMAILEDGVSANKVEEALASIGVALRDTAGEFRPLQDVFLDLGMKWDSLTRNQQAYIATVAAGSRQQSRFLSIFNNFERTLELITESQNSAGAAAKQYAIYQDSVAAAQARLTASWEKFYSKIIDNDAIKIAINSMTTLVDALSHVPPAITAIGAALGALQIQEWIRGGKAKDLLETIFGKFVTNKDTGVVEQVGKNIAKSFIDKFKEKSVEEIADTTSIWQALTKSVNKTNESMGKTPGVLSEIGTGFTTVGKVALGFIKGNWQILAVLALVAVAAGAVTWALNKNKKAYEDNIDAIKKYDQEATDLTNKTNSAESLFDSYDELISKTNRTAEEQNELNNTIKQISDIYPEAIHWVDEYGNEHLENTNILKEEIELEKDLAKQKQRAALEKRDELLSGKTKERKNWKKEDFTEIGFSSPLVDEYFKNEETLKYYKNNIGVKLLDSETIGMINSLSEFEKSSKSNYSQIIKDLNKVVEYSQVNLELLDENVTDSEKIVEYWYKLKAYIPGLGISLKDVQQRISDIDKESEEAIKNYKKEIIDILNEVKEKYNLGFITTLKDDADDNAIIKNFEAIKKYNFKELSDKLEKDQEEIIKRLQRDNTMKMSALDLVYSDKAGTAISQRAVSAKLQTFISGLSNEAYVILEKQFPENSLSKFMQKIIDNVTIENADDVSMMFEKLLDPTTSKEELKSIYDNLGQLLGEDFGEEFKDGFKAAMEKQAEEARKAAIEWFNNVFPNGGNTNDRSTARINELARIGEKYNIHDVLEADALSSYIQEIEKITSEAYEKGTTEGVENGINEVVSNANLFGTYKEHLEKIGEEAISGNIKDVITKIISEAMESAEKQITESKTNFSTATSIFNKDTQESITDEEEKFLHQQMENANSFIKINEEGEKYLTLLGKITLLEKEREDYAKSIDEKIKINEEYINNIGKDGLKNITEEQRKQINNYEQENRLLKEQKEKLSDLKNVTISAKAMSENVSYADTYYEAIDAIKTAKKEAEKANGRINYSTADSLRSINAEYSQYLKLREDGEFSYYELTAENAEKMKKIAKDKYDYDLNIAKQELENQITVLKGELNYFKTVAETEGEIDAAEYYAKVENLNNLLTDNKNAQDDRITKEQEADKEIVEAGATAAQEWANNWITASQQVSAAAESAHKSIKDGSAYNGPTAITLSGQGPSTNKTGEAGKVGDGITGADQRKEQLAQKKKQKAEEDAKKAQEELKKVQEEIKDTEDSTKTHEEEQAAIKEDAKNQVDRINAAIDALRTAQEQLKPLAPELEDISGSSGKTDDSLDKMSKTVEDLNDALRDLSDLLKEINRNLKDITVDYNPFTDLFEAWEHEWDYYYNIKRLIAQIGQQGEYIDNIILADYASSNQKLEAQHAKIGNLVAKMAANDTYITALRAGMSQTGVELMKEFGDYYKVDPTTGQLYQTDKNLSGINRLINERQEEIYTLQKLQNEKENDLALENSKLDALEQEKSAYESILSTIESQYDSLKDNEDITVDIGGLEAEKASLKAKIEISDASIDAAKSTIRGIEDEIEEIEIKVTLKDQEVSKLEDYVDRMEDKVSEYEEYWETLNSTIAEQQELLQELTDIRKDYIDTAISTEKQLYDAIVENYQDEINEKKKQYDYLKQLDQDYLRSIRDNISKERQIREDANKQRSYQQNQQRAQLLQMDTSGAFRNELASLNKEIESQRQDLYDDLVDKQVEALEKEIDKRHELYDKEVTALEERLAYMQENAILLWESVNAIVAQGADAMMAMLENTTEYMNSSELERMQLRDEWELNIKKTFEGTEEGLITTLNSLIQAGNDFIINKYPEVGEAIDKYAEVFDETRAVIEAYNAAVNTYNEAIASGKSELEAYNLAMEAAGEILKLSAEDAANALRLSFEDMENVAIDITQNIGDITGNMARDVINNNIDLFGRGSDIFQTVLDDFMSDWNDGSYKFTGYAEDWKNTVDALREQTRDNIAEIKEYYDEEGWAREEFIGSIEDYNYQLQETSKEIYDDFILERQRYRDELNGLISQIQAEISAAISNAGNAIQNAANSIQISVPQRSSGESGGSAVTSVAQTTQAESNTVEPEKKVANPFYKVDIYGYSNFQDYIQNKNGQFIRTIGRYDSNQAVTDAAAAIMELQKNSKYKGWYFRHSNPVEYIKQYLQGGLADFTGPAWLDGTKSQPEAVLNAKQTRLFTSMVSSLERAAANNSNINSSLSSSYNIGDINTNINVEKLDNETDIDRVARQVENRIMKSVRNRVSLAIA